MTFIHELNPMDHFGEISFFTSTPRSVTARTINFTECLFLKQENFIEVLKEYKDAL